MFKLINNRLKIKQIVFPSNCLLCDAETDASQLSICDCCIADFTSQDRPCCPQCGILSGSGNTCGHCLKSPPSFNATHALYTYQYPIDGLLQKYKYGNQLTIAELFGRLIARDRSATQRPDVLIPMPLHPLRLQERGFNQAVEIARVVACCLDIPLDAHCCKRIKSAPPQVTLLLKQRVRNMRNAFICERDLTGMRVALLDDVMTTGASLNALAAAVRKAGATEVECWVVARTQPHN
jgi:ComF family protein